MSVQLTYRDRNNLVDELNLFPEWSEGDKLGEKGLLRSAGLPDDWIGNLSLTGIPKIDAVNVISQLEKYGHLIIRPTHLALGGLVDYLLKNSLHLEGKYFLAYLIQQYSLINDINFLQSLDEGYLHLKLPLTNKLYDMNCKIPQPDFAWLAADDTSGLEAIWHRDTPFLDAVFLAKGAKSARAVGKVEKRTDFSPLGTGFLIRPDLVMTNSHVLPTDEDAELAQIRFGHNINIDGQVQKGETYLVKRVVYRSSASDLDFVVIQLQDFPGDDARFGHLNLSGSNIERGTLVYIVQHPEGAPQKVVLQNNRVTYVTPDYRRVQYLTNTLNGSSGSPVFNDHWDVVALHHSDRPYPQSLRSLFVIGNEGIPMKAILPEIKELI